MRRSRMVVAAVLLALSVGACGTDDPEDQTTPGSSAPAPAGDAIDPTGTMPPLEGDASSTARWPDGVTARVAAVERVPNAWGVDIPASMALVRVRVAAANEGQGVVPITPDSRHITVLYGANRTEAEQDAGYTYDDPAEEKRKGLSNKLPTRMVPGSTVEFVETSTVPVAELGSLTVVVELPTEEGIRDPYTFTGAEKVLTTAK